jgi:hypothetical protein
VRRDLADMTSPRFLRLVDPGDPAVVHIGYAIREAQDSLIVRHDDQRSSVIGDAAQERENALAGRMGEHLRPKQS